MNNRVSHEEDLEEDVYPSVTMQIGELFIDPQKDSTNGGLA